MLSDVAKSEMRCFIRNNRGRSDDLHSLYCFLLEGGRSGWTDHEQCFGVLNEVACGELPMGIDDADDITGFMVQFGERPHHLNKYKDIEFEYYKWLMDPKRSPWTSLVSRNQPVDIGDGTMINTPEFMMKQGIMLYDLNAPARMLMNFLINCRAFYECVTHGQSIGDLITDGLDQEIAFRLAHLFIRCGDDAYAIACDYHGYPHCSWMPSEPDKFIQYYKNFLNRKPDIGDRGAAAILTDSYCDMSEDASSIWLREFWDKGEQGECSFTIFDTSFFSAVARKLGAELVGREPNIGAGGFFARSNYSVESHIEQVDRHYSAKEVITFLTALYNLKKRS